MPKHYSAPWGRSVAAGADYKHPAPERTAYRTSGLFGEDCYFQVWTNRAAMARSIRMQEKREPRSGDWTPLVKLSLGEGY